MTYHHDECAAMGHGLIFFLPDRAVGQQFMAAHKKAPRPGGRI